MANKQQNPNLTIKKIIHKSSQRALGGGLSGASAMAIQVTTLMWMRTTMNYQYSQGKTTFQAMKHLYREGGIRRFYRGYLPALAQGPLSRFGDTAANVGVLTLLDSLESTKNVDISIKTAISSICAGLWRITLMPIDALKTTMQVKGKKGLGVLNNKIKLGGIRVLWHGSYAASGATIVGHFPWFYTFNMLEKHLPEPSPNSKSLHLARNAMMGFCSSVVSDIISNSIRVTKTTKQTFETPITYSQTVRHVIAAEGIIGFLGRGLKTRILSNGMQGLLFSVLWKFFQSKI